MLGKRTFIKLALAAVALAVVFFMGKVMAQDTAATEYTLEQALNTKGANSLSLQQALALAEQRSEALRAQDAATQAAQNQAIAAGELPDPMLNLEVINIPANGPDQFSLAADFMTMRGVGVSQTFTRKDKRNAQANVFNKSAEFAQAGKFQALSKLRTATAQAYLERVYLQEMLLLLQSQRTELQLQIEAADALYRSGKTAQTDVFAARTELGLMDLKIQDTQALLDNAQAELQRWVGEPADAPLAGSVDLAQSRLQGSDLFEKLHRHPEVLALEKVEATALAEVEVKQLEKSADWTLSVMYAGRGPEFSEMLSFGASRPLFVDQDNRQNQALAAANAMAAKAKAERIELHREHLAQTKRWQQTWQSNLKRVADFDRSLIPLTQQRTQAALSAYQGATGTLAEVLAARRMEIDMRMEKLRIQMDTARLWAQLEYLIPEEVQQ
ncbi:TolC family protein [Limnobacter sp.]|uniref:TolC family protein n=1 Tax=Limnobacter sp. TaxID=2003368 RepID=UPI0025B9E521|nr:TolC family protein [Limnobacter sp.]